MRLNTEIIVREDIILRDADNALVPICKDSRIDIIDMDIYEITLRIYPCNVRNNAYITFIMPISHFNILRRFNKISAKCYEQTEK